MQAMRNDFRSMEGRTKSKLQAMEQRTNAGMQQLATEFNNLKARSRPSSPVQQPTPPQDAPQPVYPIHMDIFDQSKASQPSQPVPELDKRWTPEEVGYFDWDATKVYAFTDRLLSIALNKPGGIELIQMNLVTVLRGTAFK